MRLFMESKLSGSDGSVEERIRNGFTDECAVSVGAILTAEPIETGTSISAGGNAALPVAVKRKAETNGMLNVYNYQ